MTWMGKDRSGAGRRRRQDVLERPEYGWIWKPLVVALGLYLLVTVALGIWWSRTPAPFDVERATLERRGEAAGAPAARGAVTTATLAATVATLLDKPGGYLRNDLLPPGLWLDNMPNWELGVLDQARDLARTLPEMERGDVEGLERAAERLMGDSRDWFFPTTERRLGQAVEALDAHLATLGAGGENGFAPGAGLEEWLARVAVRLDDLGLRLSASVGSREELRRLALDDVELPARTPWYRVDDIFFEARGSGWALIQLLEGVKRDQADALILAGALDDWERLIAELQRTQRRLWSPVVLNGSGFGPFANHSLVMAHHVIRAHDQARELAAKLALLPELPLEALERTPLPAPAVELDAGLEAEPVVPVEPPVVPVVKAERDEARAEREEDERKEGDEASAAESVPVPARETEPAPETEPEPATESAPVLEAEPLEPPVVEVERSETPEAADENGERDESRDAEIVEDEADDAER